jgi:hypothetical protein
MRPVRLLIYALAVLVGLYMLVAVRPPGTRLKHKQFSR